jgi:transcriptional regulator with XRE-family HTH domain
LADQCGIFRTYLSRIENGTANPTITVLASLAVALNVEIQELIK